MCWVTLVTVLKWWWLVVLSGSSNNHMKALCPVVCASNRYVISKNHRPASLVLDLEHLAVATTRRRIAVAAIVVALM